MKVNVFLYDDFDMLEAFGAAEVFGKLPEYFHVGYYSPGGQTVTSMQGAKIWTDYLTPEQQRADVLIIPGGKGARRFLMQGGETGSLLKAAAGAASFCAMIGNGSALLAQTGALFRRRICDYPMDENWNRMFTAGIYREPDVRWAADGKYYSAVSALDGIEMCLNILADLVDLEAAERIAALLGCHWDPESEEGISR